MLNELQELLYFSYASHLTSKQIQNSYWWSIGLKRLWKAKKIPERPYDRRREWVGRHP